MHTLLRWTVSAVNQTAVALCVAAFSVLQSKYAPGPRTEQRGPVPDAIQ